MPMGKADLLCWCMQAPFSALQGLSRGKAEIAEFPFTSLTMLYNSNEKPQLIPTEIGGTGQFLQMP